MAVTMAVTRNSSVEGNISARNPDLTSRKVILPKNRLAPAVRVRTPTSTVASCCTPNKIGASEPSRYLHTARSSSSAADESALAA